MANYDKQEELLTALTELRAIKRGGMDLFFRLEDSLGEVGDLANELLAGNKAQQEAGKKASAIFRKLSDKVYELQTLINIGEL